MCEWYKGVRTGHSTFQPLNTSKYRHMYSMVLKDNYIDAPHTVSVHLICNLFCQYPLCDVYCPWVPDEWHQLLLD
jgi:hypothetical protein